MRAERQMVEGNNNAFKYQYINMCISMTVHTWICEHMYTSVYVCPPLSIRVMYDDYRKA
jgi:hypothetical protein